jgi:hypothetical protein
VKQRITMGKTLGAIALAALLGAAAIWGWAMTGTAEIASFPERYRGTFEMYRYEAGIAVGAVDPIDQKQRWMYSFAENGTFQIRVLVGEEWEMFRRSGTVVADGEDGLVLTRESENGVLLLSESGEPQPGAPERYYVQWGTDEEGPYLHLTEELAAAAGQQMFLRRQE